MSSSRFDLKHVLGLVLVSAFAAGLVLAIWNRPIGEIVVRVIGVLTIANGLFLLLSRNVFVRHGAPPMPQHLEMEQPARMRMRFIGAAGLLMGVALLSADTYRTTALLASSAALSVAGAVRFPRRLFTLDSR